MNVLEELEVAMVPALSIPLAITAFMKTDDGHRMDFISGRTDLYKK